MIDSLLHLHMVQAVPPKGMLSRCRVVPIIGFWSDPRRPALLLWSLVTLDKPL